MCEFLLATVATILLGHIVTADTPVIGLIRLHSDRANQYPESVTLWQCRQGKVLTVKNLNSSLAFL